MFSENLKTLRKQKGFSQEELAARLNVLCCFFRASVLEKITQL